VKLSAYYIREPIGKCPGTFHLEPSPQRNTRACNNASVNLSEEQKDLLRRLVEHEEQGHGQFYAAYNAGGGGGTNYVGGLKLLGACDEFDLLQLRDERLIRLFTVRLHALYRGRPTPDGVAAVRDEFSAYSLDSGRKSKDERQPFKATVPAQMPTASRCRFHRQGNVWQLAFDGQEVYLPHVLGLGYIAELLRKPRVTIEAAVLREGSIESVKAKQISGLPATDKRSIATAKKEIREREALLASLSPADWTRAGKIKEEILRFKKYLAQTTDHRGKARLVHGSAEKARTSTTNAIDRAIANIKKVHPALGVHLDQAIRRGTSLVYSPEDISEWDF
jgi:hypothetical protein